MHKFLYLFVFLVPIMIIGCSGFGYPRMGPDCAEVGLQALPYPMEHMNFGSFSVLPPQGPNWCIFKINRDTRVISTIGAYMGKNPFGGRMLHQEPSQSEQLDTLAVNFGIHDKGEALKMLSEGLGKDIKDIKTIEELDRYYGEFVRKELSNIIIVKKIKSLHIEPFHHRSNAICLLQEYDIESTGLSESHPNELFGYELHHIICLHPTKPLVFWIEYSERFLAQYPPKIRLIKQYWKELEPFFTSFDFES